MISASVKTLRVELKSRARCCNLSRSDSTGCLIIIQKYYSYQAQRLPEQILSDSTGAMASLTGEDEAKSY